jgi:hypothetical protein
MRNITLHLNEEEAQLILDCVRNYRPTFTGTFKELVYNEQEYAQESAHRNTLVRTIVKYITSYTSK